MASGSIKGITIELNGDTKGLDSALKSLTSQSVSLSNDLKKVNNLLKLDPGNAELVAQKQQILAQYLKYFNSSSSEDSIKEREEERPEMKETEINNSLSYSFSALFAILKY